jgi:RNA polymerase sigma factor (sigma-70 family)
VSEELSSDGAAGSVTLMIHQLRSEDPLERDAAARLVWERYFHQLLTLAKRQLSTKIRARVDEEDVLQSVYESVCRRQGRGEFDLLGRDDLWRLLVTVTLRKARNAGRWHTRAKRDARRESQDPRNPAGEEFPIRELASLEPTPDEALEFADAFGERLNGLPDEILRTIALRKLEGFSNREIARSLGCAERSIERKLSLIRHAWQRDDSNT